MIQNIPDKIISEHLKKLNIPHLPPPYNRLQNNNYAITDNKHFFIKVSDSKTSLQTELDIIKHLNGILHTYTKNIYQIKQYNLIIVNYIPHFKLTASTITTKNVENILNQLKQINEIPSTALTSPRKLNNTIPLVKKRLKNPKLNNEQIRQINLLTERYVIPYINKYDNSLTLTHTDLKLENILQINNKETVIVDYESIKPAPPELDLASLYQDLFQTGKRKTYYLFHEAFKNIYPNFNEQTLNESVLFKNILTTTNSINLPTMEIFEKRLNILLNTTYDNIPPRMLPKVYMNQIIKN